MKKSKIVSLFSAAVIAFLNSNIGVAAQPQSYPLFCKGGSMNITVRPQVRDGGTYFGFTFKQGKRAATSGLGAGECTWSDRGMRSDESSSIGIKDKDLYFSTFIDLRGKARLSADCGRNGCDLARSVNKMLDAMRHGKTFQVYAYQYVDGAGRKELRITKFGP